MNPALQIQSPVFLMTDPPPHPPDNLHLDKIGTGKEFNITKTRLIYYHVKTNLNVLLKRIIVLMIEFVIRGL